MADSPTILILAGIMLVTNVMIAIALWLLDKRIDMTNERIDMMRNRE